MFMHQIKFSHVQNLRARLTYMCQLIVNKNTSQPYQKIRFLDIFFRILNMFAIVSNLQKKFNFCQNPQK